jgi:hypothetical protein
MQRLNFFSSENNLSRTVWSLDDERDKMTMSSANAINQMSPMFKTLAWSDGKLEQETKSHTTEKTVEKRKGERQDPSRTPIVTLIATESKLSTLRRAVFPT